jgi:hypothetical protein
MVIARTISTILDAIQNSVPHWVISAATTARDLTRIKSSTRYFTDCGEISGDLTALEAIEFGY